MATSGPRPESPPERHRNGLAQVCGVVFGVARGVALAGGVLLALVVVVTMVNVSGFSANVVLRPFGGSVAGLPGYEDAVSLFVGLAVLLMLPWCQAQRGHVAVDTLLRHAPAWVSNGLARLVDATMAVTALFFAVMLSQAAIDTRGDGTLTPVLGWPVWPFQWPGVVALLLWSATAALMALAPRATATWVSAHDDGGS